MNRWRGFASVREESRSGVRPAGESVIFAMVLVAVTGAARAETWRITPSVALTETYSDNITLVADDLRQRGWITDLSPGLRVDANGARVRGFLEYRLHEMRYTGASELDSSQNFLASRFTVEAFKDYLFVDARADTTQESRSPFGSVTAPGSPTASANRVETTTLQVSPYLKGPIGTLANYQLRLSEGEIRTDDATLPDTRTREWIGRIASPPSSAALNWVVEGSTVSARNDVIGQLDDARFRAKLFFSLRSDLRFWLGDGYDRTDFAGPPERRNDTPGAGFAWIPSPRTQVAALYERRFFGDGYSASASHRARRTVFRLSTRKDAAILPGLSGAGGRASLADLLAELLTTTVADPNARDEQARSQVSTLGLPTSTPLSGSLLTARPVVYRFQEASAAFQGTTHTVTFSVSDREEREIGSDVSGGTAPIGSNDLSRRGYAANWAARVTPNTTASVSYTRLLTDGVAAGSPNTRQSDTAIRLVTRLGQRTSATFGLRRAKFDTTAATGSYRETAAFAVVSYGY